MTHTALRGALALAALAAATATGRVPATTAAKNKDILLIAIDDLRPQLACTEVPGTIRPTMSTPHICALAGDALLLERSQVAMATCSPSRHVDDCGGVCVCSICQRVHVSRFSLPISPALPHRTSLLTGRHPGTTHIWDLYSYFRTIPGLANATTFPQYFKDRGYHTFGMGKIFHPGTASGAAQPGCPSNICTGEDDLKHSWTGGVYMHGKEPHAADPNRCCAHRHIS